MGKPEASVIVRGAGTHHNNAVHDDDHGDVNVDLDDDILPNIHHQGKDIKLINMQLKEIKKEINYIKEETVSIKNELIAQKNEIAQNWMQCKMRFLAASNLCFKKLNLGR